MTADGAAEALQYRRKPRSRTAAMIPASVEPRDLLVKRLLYIILGRATDPVVTILRHGHCRRHYFDLVLSTLIPFAVHDAMVENEILDMALLWIEIALESLDTEDVVSPSPT